MLVTRDRGCEARTNPQGQALSPEACGRSEGRVSSSVYSFAVDPTTLDSRARFLPRSERGPAPIDDEPEHSEPLAPEDSASDASDARERMRVLVGRLSPRERAVTELSLSKMRQRDIAAILGVSQPTIAYVAKRAREKLRRMAAWEGAALTTADVREQLGWYDFPQSEIDALATIFETSCHAETERRLNLPQRTALDIHRAGLARMQKLPGLAQMARAFGWLLQRENRLVSHFVAKPKPHSLYFRAKRG